jgi:hypothetical protein
VSADLELTTAALVLAGVVALVGAFSEAGQLLVTVPPRTPLGQVVGPLTQPVGLDAVTVPICLDVFCRTPPDPSATRGVGQRAEQVGQPAGRVHGPSLRAGVVTPAQLDTNLIVTI